MEKTDPSSPKPKAEIEPSAADAATLMQVKLNAQIANIAKIDAASASSGASSAPLPPPPPPPAEEGSDADMRTFVYKASELAAVTGFAPTKEQSAALEGRKAAGTVGLLKLIDPAVTVQDLTRDKLLEGAPRMDVDGKTVTSLGGIPLFGKLGQGAMGAVYYGIDPQFRTAVAIKVFPMSMTSDDMIAKLYQMVRNVAALKSKFLVTVKDINKEGGLCYIVLEYISGISGAAYAQRLRSASGAIGIPEAVALDMCVAAAEGLAEAHRNGIMHGDIRPQNLLIPRRGSDIFVFSETKLTDMGIPRIEELGGLLSGSNAPMGQPGFMAPEQAVEAKAARKPSDIFSMGATLYALLTGKPPFEGDNPMNAILASIQTPHVPVIKLRPDVSPATSEVIDRCLAKQPADRFADGSALLEVLSVCRLAMTGNKVTQPSAIKRVTMVLEKEEVGKKVLGSDSATPSRIDFNAALGMDPEPPKGGTRMLEKRQSGGVNPPARISGERASVKSGVRQSVGTSIQRKPGEPGGSSVAPIGMPRTAAASSPAAQAVSSSTAGLGGIVKVLIGLVVILMLALVGMLIAKPKADPGGNAANQAGQSKDLLLHSRFLQNAKDKVKDDTSAARGILDSAKQIGVTDVQAIQQQNGVEALIIAYESFKAGKDLGEVQQALTAAKKFLPTDAALELLQMQIDAKQKKP